MLLILLSVLKCGFVLEAHKECPVSSFISSPNEMNRLCSMRLIVSLWILPMLWLLVIRQDSRIASHYFDYIQNCVSRMQLFVMMPSSQPNVVANINLLDLLFSTGSITLRQSAHLTVISRDMNALIECVQVVQLCRLSALDLHTNSKMHSHRNYPNFVGVVCTFCW